MIDELRQKLMNALARREYGYYELMTKFAHEYPQDEIAILLDEFIERGWQSDERYAYSYVRSAVARGKGPLYIKQYLKNQQIKSSLIDSALAEHDFFMLARQAYDKKYLDAPANSAALAKRKRFLLGRGFSFDHINEALHHHD